MTRFLGNGHLKTTRVAPMTADVINLRRGYGGDGHRRIVLLLRLSRWQGNPKHPSGRFAMHIASLAAAAGVWRRVGAEIPPRQKHGGRLRLQTRAGT